MLSFVTPIAYDFAYAFETIQSYYGIADEIILGLDRDRMSFSGSKYPFDEEAFCKGLAAIDARGIVQVIEGDFHSLPHPLANEQHERLTLTAAAKPGNWIIQIDSDELLLNAQDFYNWMHTVPSDVGILAQWVTVFKRWGDDFLVVNEGDGKITIGTRDRQRYTHLRQVDQRCLMSPLILLHQSYGRTRQEVELKLRHWGHSKEVETASMLALWDKVTLENHREFRDFHPLHAPFWQSLRHVRVAAEGG